MKTCNDLQVLRVTNVFFCGYVHVHVHVPVHTHAVVMTCTFICVYCHIPPLQSLQGPALGQSAVVDLMESFGFEGGFEASPPTDCDTSLFATTADRFHRNIG